MYYCLVLLNLVQLAVVQHHQQSTNTHCSVPALNLVHVLVYVLNLVYHDTYTAVSSLAIVHTTSLVDLERYLGTAVLQL